MGTTSEKLTYLNNTKQLLKDKINNLGGSIDEQTTFRNYANQLQNVYDNLPKTEYQEGTEVTLSSTLKGKLDFDDGKVGFGQASQDSTQGYNILPITTPNGTYQGVSFTNNADGTITLNGTPNATGPINIYTGEIMLNGDYTFYIYGNDNTISCSATIGGTNESILNYASTGSAITKSYSNKTMTQLYLWATPTLTFTNKIIKPMLVNGTDTTKPFEKYTGGQASPNPSYPQEIKYVRGKNRFNISSAEYFMWLYTNGQYGVSTDPNLLSDFIKVQKGQKYVFSGIPSAYSIRVCSYTAQNVPSFKTCLINNLSNVYDFTADADYIRFAIGNADTRVLDKIQLEEGTQPTPYLPYNTIEEVVSGIQLLDISKFESGYSLGADGIPAPYTTTLRLTNTTPIDVEGLEKVTLSYSAWDGGNKFIYSLLKADNTLVAREANKSSGTTLTINGAKYLYICFYDGATPQNVTDAMLVEGNTSAPYEPYITPTSYQLSLGDIELCGIGDYKDYIWTDRSTGKWYKKGNIGKKILNGSEDWNAAGSVVTGTTRFYFNLTGVFSSTNVSDNIKYVQSDKFLPLAWYEIYNTDTTTQNAIANYNTTTPTGRIVIRIADIYANTVNNFKTWLNSNNVIVYYVLATSTDTEITDTTLIEQLEALYNAHSNNGTTIITSNGDLPLIIKVRGLKGE